MKGIYFSFFAIIMACSNQSSQKTETIRPAAETHNPVAPEGVLILYTDSAQRKDFSFELLNEDQSLFRTISSNLDESSMQSLRDNIFAYYPDYNIVHFSANPISGSQYSVKVGAIVKLITKTEFMEFLTWPDYILRFFSVATRDNPLRTEPSDNAEVIGGLAYEDLNFRNVELAGDWVKVLCNRDCEGCPDNAEVTGWLRWKKNEKIILDIYYTC